MNFITNFYVLLGALCVFVFSFLCQKIMDLLQWKRDFRRLTLSCAESQIKIEFTPNCSELCTLWSTPKDGACTASMSDGLFCCLTPHGECLVLVIQSNPHAVYRICVYFISVHFSVNMADWYSSWRLETLHVLICSWRSLLVSAQETFGQCPHQHSLRFGQAVGGL